MRIPHPKLTRVNIFASILFSLSFLILMGTIYFSYNIHVLKDWQLILPKEVTNIHEGDVVNLQSQYTKLRPVTGVATRYIECQNQNGAYIRYLLNERTADHPSGNGGTGIIITVPTGIVPALPTTCKFSIVVKYKVLPFRTVPEFNSTRTFELSQAGAP